MTRPAPDPADRLAWSDLSERPLYRLLRDDYAPDMQPETPRWWAYPLACLIALALGMAVGSWWAM